jgi:hypothetical protein
MINDYILVLFKFMKYDYDFIYVDTYSELG